VKSYLDHVHGEYLTLVGGCLDKIKTRDE